AVRQSRDWLPLHSLRSRAGPGNYPGISGSVGNSDEKDRRVQTQNGVTADARPAVVDERMRTGDRTFDAVIGKSRREALTARAERSTGFTLISRLPRREAALLKNELAAMLSSYKETGLTITAEDGKKARNIRKSLDCLTPISSSPIPEAFGNATATKPRKALFRRSCRRKPASKILTKN
ncbi:MAG: hypothetical protein ONB12_07175, partial [candidate division KSB1 bacterium]|nr:hypothetical protein [candidate division KSB1 bacterium]